MRKRLLQFMRALEYWRWGGGGIRGLRPNYGGFHNELIPHQANKRTWADHLAGM
jgi:hypothetical protein